MRIGIIGAGKVGSVLARRFAAAGHDILIANSRKPHTLRKLADELGDRVRPVLAADAARSGDLVVVAIPFGRYAELPTEGLAGKTVIDASNYHPDRDGHFPELDQDRTTSSELIQARQRDAHLVKAFNTMRWDHLRDYGRQSSAQRRYALPLSGDDLGAKRKVQDLIELLGFEPVDAGDLANGGRRQQPGSPAYLAELAGDELRTRIGVRVL